MSRLGPTGLTQLLTNIKTWITTKLANYVTTNTSQSISGIKTFPTNINLANTSTSQIEYWALKFSKTDTNGTGASQIGVYQPSNSNDFVATMRLGNPRGDNKPTTGDGVNTGNCWSGIGVYYNYALNRGYPYAPSCNSWGDSSNADAELASTAWVRRYCETTKGFLTSHQSLSNYVTLDGDQTISGAKTFTGDVIGINKNDSTEDADNLYSTTTGAKLTYYTTTNGSTKLVNVPAAVNTTLESRTIRRLSASDWIVEQICHNSTGLYYRKGTNGTWSTWKTFAFTDSSISGNAGTATQFSADTTVALTGDATGTSAGSKKGWSVPVTLANSGVTAGSYGPSEAASPTHGGTFSVPYVTVDAKGRVTAASTITITLPADSNTDTKVTQTATAASSDYPVILGNTANNTATVTETARFSKCLYVNARYGNISIKNAYNSANTKGVRDSATTYQNGTVIFKCYDGSEMGRIHCESNKGGYTRTYMQVRNYIKDGAISPEGTAVTSYFALDLMDTGSKRISTDAYWGANVTPDTNNSRTLGTSSLRWKACYSNAYYLGTTAFGDIVTHNASEFLTSHQSLSSCVKNVVTNSQTIKSTGITRGTAPSSTQTFGIVFTDNNGASIGNVYGQYATNKSTYVGLYAYKGTTTANDDNASVRVGYDASGNACTYAPTPATADNSTQIATTAFVKAQGYLTSHQSLANYVTTNTDQSISGIKSHSKHISILGDYVGNESSTNGRSCLYLKANRDTDGKSGLYVTKFRQNVAQGSMGSSDVVFLSHDILENETRTNAGFVESYSNWEDDVPKGMSICSTIATSNLGTSAKPWTNTYAVNFYENGTALSSKYLTVSAISGGASTSAGNITPVKGTIILGFAKSSDVTYSTNFGGVLVAPSGLYYATCVYTTSTSTMAYSKGPSVEGTGTWKLMGGGVSSPGTSTRLLFGLWIKIV